MSVHRRDFLHAGLTASVTAGALAVTPRWLQALGRPASAPPLPAPLREMPPITDATVRELALRAIEAARAAGARYADVRLTYTRQRLVAAGYVDTTWLDVGVRALVDGYWGFAASAHWTPAEMVRLGQAAVHQAQTNALGKPRVVELSPIPVIADGDWAHAVERDPFDMPLAEIKDYLKGLEIYGAEKAYTMVTIFCRFQRQDKAFASSEGSYATQRLYRTQGVLGIGQISSMIIAGASRGWEYISQAPLREEIHRLAAEVEEDQKLPQKQVEVGRYDVVFDAQSMAALLDGTLGAATELDRALGYEANASGTSYLTDPLGMLGSYQAGAPLLSVTADRTTPGGLATVKWDDDGAEPDQFPLVTDGVLVDLQTHREGAGWLQPAYTKLGRGAAARSHGCAAAPRAYEAPLLHCPNLTLAPAPEALDFDQLVGRLGRGLAVKQGGVDMDFQCLNGLAGGRVYEVQGGQRVARIAGAGLLLRAPEFWQSLLALGGAASQRPFAVQRSKGEPPQTTWHTVRAVPGLVKQVTTIDQERQA